MNDTGNARDGDTIISLHAGYETNGVYTNAFLARPVEAGSRPGMLLLSGMHGLSWTQRELTRMYARAGFVALSPDYMGGQLPSGRTAALLAKNSLDVNPVVEALAGGAAFLRILPFVNGKVGIMGFCLGGGLVLLAVARTDAFQAGIVYHQSLFPDMRELAGIRCRLQCHYGTDDHSTPKDEVDAFTRELDRLGKSYEIHWYEGMGHSFAQIAPDAEVAPARRAAADLSHARSFEFLRRELAR
jgi:carboxymethylenebutenolidase